MIKLRCRTNQIRSNRYCRVLIAAPARYPSQPYHASRAPRTSPRSPRAARPIEPPSTCLYKGKLARIGRGAAEAEDLVQEGDIGDPPQATYLCSRRAANAVGARNRALQADRPPSRQQDVADRFPDRRSSGTDGEGRQPRDRG